MNRDESIELWLQGKDAWNEWAQECLDERKALEEAGKWDATANSSGSLEGQNQATKDWIAEANVNFRNLWLRPIDQPEISKEIETKNLNGRKSIPLDVDNIDFENFIFPNEVDFGNTIFSGDAEFGYAIFSHDTDFSFASFSDIAYFSSATFSGDVYFSYAAFGGDTEFHSASYSGFANFDSATFNGYASFSLASFGDKTSFDWALFSDLAFFDSTTFSGNASFRSAEFSDDADFSSAIFKGHTYFNKGDKNCIFEKPANFNLAHFEKPVSFKQAIFKDTANFASITSDKSFNLLQTKFTLVPDFTEAAFHAPPVLDEIKIAEPLIKRDWRWCGEENEPRSSYLYNNKVANDPTDTRKYRALAKMAAEAKDYQNEMQFFADEQRCRRFWYDKPFGKGAGRFWFGLVYEWASDFGRSFWRPFIGWLTTLMVFTAWYFFQADKTRDFFDSLYLSLRHGLVISGLTRDGHMKTVLERMYCADLPAFAFIAQTFISAVFIFLLLLAIRNQFKIR